MNFSGKTYDKFVFKHTFTCILAGPTGCGKTNFVSKILLQNQQLIQPAPTKIYFCYASWQEAYDNIKQNVPNVIFHKGLIGLHNFDKNENNLLIIDDLIDDSINNSSIQSIFTRDSHHSNISVFLITQNIFLQGKHSRTISLNAQYMILFKNPRDSSQIATLSRQMFPNATKYLVEAYEDATDGNFGYIFLDLKQTTEKELRVQTGVLPGERRLIYIVKNLLN